jgi:hypothetical protein
LSSYKERKKAHKLAALATQIQRPNQTRTHTSHSDAESIIDRESGEFCKNLSISEGIGGGAGLARFKSIKSSARSVMSILISTNKIMTTPNFQKVVMLGIANNHSRYINLFRTEKKQMLGLVCIVCLLFVKGLDACLACWSSLTQFIPIPICLGQSIIEAKESGECLVCLFCA